MSEADAETVYDTVTDFEGLHEYGHMTLPAKIQRLADDRIRIDMSQGLRFGFIKVGLHENFELRLDRPRSVRTERYLGGSFDDARFDAWCFALEHGRTLLVCGFLADLSSVGWMAKVFFKHQPELAFAITGNVPVVPIYTWAEEAERRARRTRTLQPGIPLWEILGEGALRPALAHGYLTVGRFRRGQIEDIATAARVAATRDECWDLIRHPERFASLLSFVERGRADEPRPGVLTTEIDYLVKVGPLKRRYAIRRTNRSEGEHALVCTHGTADGQPLVAGEYLFDDGDQTVYCHRYFTDIKKDRISSFFLKRHPELERLIATYAPSITVRAIRRALGAPRV